MLIAQSTVKPLHSYLSPHLLSTTSARPCYKQCCSEKGSYSDNFPFSYVILFLLFTYVNYTHEN
jgi:hypothetical protein